MFYKTISVATFSLCPFKHLIDYFGLVDLGFVGNPFTWCNNRQGATSIKERLDRDLASLSWIYLHLEFSLKYIPASFSDHHPISLNTVFFSSFLPRPFCFEEFWTKNSFCGSVVEAAWFRLALGSPTQCLVSKLRHTRNSLRRWNYLHFGKLHAWIKFTLVKLDVIHKSPPSLSTFSLETSLKTSLDDLLLREEILWKSKSRELWLSCSNLNTKFFHISTIIKGRSNVVNFLKTDSGS